MKDYERQTVNRALLILYCKLIKAKMMSPKNAYALKLWWWLEEFTDVYRHCMGLCLYFSVVTEMSEGLPGTENCLLFQQLLCVSSS